MALLALHLLLGLAGVAGDPAWSPIIERGSAEHPLASSGSDAASSAVAYLQADSTDLEHGLVDEVPDLPDSLRALIPVGPSPATPELPRPPRRIGQATGDPVGLLRPPTFLA